MSLLKKIGHVLLTIVTFGAIAAKDAAPFLSIFNPALGALLNATSSAVITAEAAGASAVNGAPSTDTGAQKAALVLAAIKPQVLQFASTIGVPAPTDEQIQAYIDGFVAALNALQVPSDAVISSTSSPNPTM